MPANNFSKHTSLTFFACALIITGSISQLAASNPEAATPMQAKPLVSGRHSMIVTNNPWATKAAQSILDQGGSAVDAAIAAAFVLGLTEPQSSGIGGGGYAITFAIKNKQLTAYDGRETAPHTANADWFKDSSGKLMDVKTAMLTAKSIGTPGEVALLKKLHADHGILAWQTLLKPAITLAQHGFPMSPRLHTLLNMDAELFLHNNEVRTVYFSGNKVKPVGTLIRNPAYAKTLTALASDPDALYRGKLAADIIAAINTQAGSKLFNASDFADYRVMVHPALCASYRNLYAICTVPPSSAGGATTLELLLIYAAKFNGTNINDASWMYYFLEASKLAFADRDQYLADPAFVPQPLPGLLQSDYISSRAALITDHAAATPVAAGKPKGASATAADTTPKQPGTTSIAIVDKDGNAISMTVTIESQFGSHVFTNGFFLNNELTDFSFAATNAEGKPIANSVAAHKRPRSSISPVIVLDQQKNVVALTGSPGGLDIICYVAKNIIAMLDMKLKPDAASASPNFCSANSDPAVELYIRPVSQIHALTARGEVIQRRDMVSGVTNILRTDSGWTGAADPRREGTASGK